MLGEPGGQLAGSLDNERRLVGIGVRGSPKITRFNYGKSSSECPSFHTKLERSDTRPSDVFSWRFCARKPTSQNRSSNMRADRVRVPVNQKYRQVIMVGMNVAYIDFTGHSVAIPPQPSGVGTYLHFD